VSIAFPARHIHADNPGYEKLDSENVTDGFNEFCHLTCLRIQR
jgi:hypothetical protein